MTLNEFKAWLDGFTDAIGDAPTPEQWAKIKAKLDVVQPFAIPNPMPPPIIGPYYSPHPDQSWRTPLPPVTCISLGSMR